MTRIARESMRFVGVMMPVDLLRALAGEMRRERRWLFANRSRAIRVLLEEALSARAESRAALSKRRNA
jgi:hypothetical protein